MKNRQVSVWRWVAQICIIAALFGFILFVFFGPTDLKSQSTAPEDNGSKTLGETRPFALFTPVSAESSSDAAIDYSNDQLQKIRAAAKKANLKTALYVPHTGTAGDYLMEIRVFRQKQMIQLLYPHFGILESARPIHAASQAEVSKKTNLSIGEVTVEQYQNGGCHLAFHLQGTYIMMDTSKIGQLSSFKRIAESVKPLDSFISSN